MHLSTGTRPIASSKDPEIDDLAIVFQLVSDLRLENLEAGLPARPSVVSASYWLKYIGRPSHSPTLLTSPGQYRVRAGKGNDRVNVRDRLPKKSMDQRDSVVCYGGKRDFIRRDRRELSVAGCETSRPR
jgi:hypothetical protein